MVDRPSHVRRRSRPPARPAGLAALLAAGLAAGLLGTAGSSPDVSPGADPAARPATATATGPALATVPLGNGSAGSGTAGSVALGGDELVLRSPTTPAPPAATPNPAPAPGTSLAPGSDGAPSGSAPADGNPTDGTPADGAATGLRALPPAAGLPPSADTAPAPRTLAIPALGVTGALVQPVGVTPDGQLEVPDVSRVGWYRFSAAPGTGGSTVLAAHIAYNGIDGVFRHLDQLQPGDRIEVALADGRTAAYTVDRRALYRKEALPDDVFARSGPNQLVLITCGGRFNLGLRSYESNIVAFAHLVVQTGP